MKITMVVVLYKQKLEDSKTFQTLKQTLFLQKKHVKDIELILYDNSPVSQEYNPLEYEGITISYRHDPSNQGIVAAYNYAWTCAKKNESQYLLLLDHDTELTSDYIDNVLNLPMVAKDVVAIVPKVVSENTMISPVYSTSLRPLQGEKPGDGIQEKPVMAINSGALIKVEFLNQIGGFNQNFPLDYLDHWLFYEIYAKGFKVMVLNVSLEHELSVMDYNRVSLDRYKSIIDSESNFYQKYKRDLYPSYRTQLAKRLLKQILTVKNKQIAMYTLRKLLTMQRESK
jgi:GT2 family glycosyltransferase